MACKTALPSWLHSSLLTAMVSSASLVLTATPRAGAEEPESNSASPTVPDSTEVESISGDRDDSLARARAIVALAEPLFLAGQYAAALAEYTRAYELLAGHPRQYWVLHNLAACNERLFRYDVAVELYEEYLRRAPATELDRAEVSAVLSTLRSLLATLVVESSVSGEVWLDDRRLGATPGRWRVPAGRHIVEVRADHHESQRRELQLSAGQLKVDHFQLQRLATNAGPPPAYFWVAVGLTGAATVLGTSAGLAALSAHEQGRDRAALYLDTQADAERTRRWALTSDIAFGAAVVFGATATVLYFVTDWPTSPAQERAREPSARRPLRVTLGAAGGIGATLRGQF